LRAWASDTNPLWASGLRDAIDRIRVIVDKGKLDDDGSNGWVADPVEGYAEALAFASLVEPDAPLRAEDARRARRLLMRGIDAAAYGAADNKPYRSPGFSIDDRSRWWGEGWGLTVDWIYPYLSSSDKATIRSVFLRWVAEDITGGQTTDDHPQPVGLRNDPRLLADPVAVRWATNNYYTAHARNIALMAMALDPADDPGGQLRSHLQDATGAFLYVTDHLLSTELAGGAPPDGVEYGPQSLGYVAETLLALHAAGPNGPATSGRQDRFDNPFWDQVGTWLLSSVSPAPTVGSDGVARFLPVPYGDAQTYGNPDWIEVFGPLGISDASVGGHAERLAMSRWIERNLPPGGVSSFIDRVRDPNYARDAILYFLLFDPGAATPPDPRPALPTTLVASGVGQVSARTGWGPDASWFTFADGWNMIDHQSGDGLSIGFYQNGEWLTKDLSGYDVNTSDFKNTLAIQNAPPEHNDRGDYRHIAWEHGSQYGYVVDGPGHLSATSSSARFVYVSGDATDLYNSAAEGSTQVTDASCSVLWLKPDVIVAYDRATTRLSGGFKRFFLQLPGAPTINGAQATVRTRSGQQLSVATLLPADAAITAEKIPLDSNRDVGDEGQIADNEPMTHRLRIEAPGAPADARFLNVLQGLNAGAPAAPVTLVEANESTPFVGAVVGATAVLFPASTGVAPGVELNLPASVSSVIVTGLMPSTHYTALFNGSHLDVQAGSGPSTDAGGVLIVGTG
jgi:hypothetical protein